jgi:hypothetical protein
LAALAMAAVGRLQMYKYYRRKESSENAMLSRRIVCVLAGISLLACSGCYPIPVRFPTRTTDGAAQSIDLTFLKPGLTSRDEVAGKLASIATNVTQEDFFWGRPRVSKYRQIIMVGYVPVGPGDRMWGTQNLLISYDQRGMVKSWSLVGDRKLLAQLDLLDDAASLPAPTSLVLAESVVYRRHGKNVPAGEKGYAQLTLELDSVECFGVKIARTEVRAIAATNSGQSDRLSLKMFFSHPIDFSKTPLQRRTDRIDLSVDARSVLLLHRYMKQSAPVK